MSSGTTAIDAIDSLTIGVCAYAGLFDEDVRRALESAGHEVTSWHEDHEAAIEACRENEPELFLLGARRADLDALSCLSALTETSSSTKVVLICERTGDGDVRKLLDAGVSGLVALDEAPATLGPVIRVVQAGQVSVPGSRGRELRKRILTSREKQILGLVVMGMTNAEIAAKLFVAESTVKSHLSSAFAKLGVSSRSEAATVILDPQSGAGLGILTIPTG
jgi:DNA-binding NarL/FixJ family response regulator